MVAIDNYSNMLSRFRSQLALVGGHFATLPSIPAARDYIANLALQAEAKQIVVSDPAISQALTTGTPSVTFKVASRENMSRQDFFAALVAADIGVGRVDLAIAETGTLVIVTSDEADRLVSALPRIHVALLEISQIVYSLEEAVPRISRILGENRGAAVSLISASSRTTDVGGILILGVHGPKELHIIVLDGAAGSA